MNSVLANIGWLAQAQVQSGWFDMDQDRRFGITITAIICGTIVVISVVGIACGMTAAMHRARTEGELKREMLDRGMSGEDISLVIRPPDNFLDRWASGRRNKDTKQTVLREAGTGPSKG